eukprot:Lankesteria_metandrocarpae@DN5423_c0_g2_i1.p1
MWHFSFVWFCVIHCEAFASQAKLGLNLQPTTTNNFDLLGRLSKMELFASLKSAADAAHSLSLQTLCSDAKRNDRLFVDACEGCVLDMTRQQISVEVLDQLLAYAKASGIEARRDAMFSGDKINNTENRAVLHTALRAPLNAKFTVDGKNVMPDVHAVLDSIKRFSEEIRSGVKVGHTGKPLTSVVCVGIGGSYLGPEFVYEALKTSQTAAPKAKGRVLRFLANVDPIDVQRATEGLNPEETLVVIISKTFTTAETMLNARTVKQWLTDRLGNSPDVISKHTVAVSTNLSETDRFGIERANVFGFWDWVGGRYSVSSAVGVLPLALQYGYNEVEQFLKGAHAMDEHFRSAPMAKNLPVLSALVAHWNTVHLGHKTLAVLPYCQALLRFPAHYQQLSMESNGKRVDKHGKVVPVTTGQVIFGEPGTNGQHSFYQLMHQGQVVPAEFIGFLKSQNELHLPGEKLSSHDELMSNFFAQPDALAFGKSVADLQKEGVPTALQPHKLFDGNRPSTILLMPELTAFYCGALLSLYENRTAVEGFLLDLNSFDQWGVELGKALAKSVGKQLETCRGKPIEEQRSLVEASNFADPTKRLLKKYLLV